MHNSKWKKAVWKGYSMIPFMEFMTFMTFGKTVERVKRSVVVRGSWRKKRGINRWNAGAMGAVKHSVWYCDDKYMALCICQNPQKVQEEE